MKRKFNFKDNKNKRRKIVSDITPLIEEKKDENEFRKDEDDLIIDNIPQIKEDITPLIEEKDSSDGENITSLILDIEEDEENDENDDDKIFLEFIMNNGNTFVKYLNKDTNVVVYKLGCKKTFWYKCEYGEKKKTFETTPQDVVVSKANKLIKGDIKFNDHIPFINELYIEKKIYSFGIFKDPNALKTVRNDNFKFTLYLKYSFLIILQNFTVTTHNEDDIQLGGSKIIIIHSSNVININSINIDNIQTKNPLKDFVNATKSSVFYIGFEKGLIFTNLEKPQYLFKEFCKNFFKNRNNVFKDIVAEYFFINIHNYYRIKYTLETFNKVIEKFNEGNYDSFLQLRAFYFLMKLVCKYIPICLNIQYTTNLPFKYIINGRLSLIGELLLIKEGMQRNYIFPSDFNEIYNKGTCPRYQFKETLIYISKNENEGIYGFDLKSAYSSCFCEKYIKDKNPIVSSLVNIWKTLLNKKNKSNFPRAYKLLINIIYGILNSKSLQFIKRNPLLLQNVTSSCKEKMEDIVNLISNNLRSGKFKKLYGMTDSMYYIADKKNFNLIIKSIEKKLSNFIKLSIEGGWKYGIVFDYNNYIFQYTFGYNQNTDVAKGKWFSSSTIPKTIRMFCFKIVNYLFVNNGISITKIKFIELYEKHKREVSVNFTNFQTSTSFSYNNDDHLFIKNRNEREYNSFKDRVYCIYVRENGNTYIEELGFAINYALTIDYWYIYEKYKEKLLNFFEKFILIEK